jgi:putative transposase
MNALYENGLTKELSTLSEPLKEHDSTTSTSISKIQKRGRKKQTLQSSPSLSVTVESPVLDKKTICNDKSNTCKNDSQNTELSKILVQESISSDQDYEPFWNLQCQDLSNKLWCPIETDSVGSRLNCLNGSFRTTTSNSWFSMHQWNHRNLPNSQKTSFPSYKFSIAESMEDENTKKQKKPPRKLNPVKKSKQQIPNSSRKIRLKPSPEDTITLRKWFGCCRATYNWALSEIQKRHYKINAFWLRNRFINACNIPSNKSYLLDTPKEVRYGAIEDLVNGFKLNFQKGSKFEMKFRTKKEIHSILIPKDSIKAIITEEEALCNKNIVNPTKKQKIYNTEGVSFYPSYIKNIIKMSTRRCNTIKYDCKLTMDKLGRFYLCVPRYETVHENQMDDSSWCALDPGIRTFMTLYSPTNETAIKYAVGDNLRLYRLCLSLDKLISKRSLLKGRKMNSKRNRMKKAEYRLRNKLRNIVDEVHWKIIHHITKHFKNVILPPFEIKNMVKKTERKITTKSVRCLYSWRHFTFRQRLINRAKITGTNVFVKEESFTTKTCTICGNLNDVKGLHTIKCSKCKNKIDRDLNGARNEFLKHITISSIT